MKKFLSLVLALVMTMSLVTVSAGAKDFTDSSKIAYDEAVDVMSAVKVIDGYTDGSFNPSATLTRGAAAKIICNLILGPTTASALVADAAPYKDVPTNHTFAGYIAYCQKEGIISGYADGTFKPANSLTGYAFMKMLLGALGYKADQEGYTGPNWSINVAKRAINVGLNDDLNGSFNGVKAVNREEACLYAFNTLQATMVEYDKNSTITVGNITIKDTSAAKEMVNNAKTETIKDDNKMQFAEKYFDKLSISTKASDKMDDFGRPATTWIYDKETVGTYADKADQTLVLNKALNAEETLISDSDYLNYNDKDVASDVAVYVNGDAKATKKANLSSVSLKAGDQVEVFENDDGDVQTVAVIRYTLAQIDEIETKLSSTYTKQGATASITLKDLGGTGIGNTYYDVYDADSDKELTGFSADSYKEDTVLAVAMKGDVILESYVASEVSGKITAVNSGSKANVTLGGSKYSIHSDFDLGGTAATKSNLTSLNLDDSTYTVYTDKNGYVIGIDETEATKITDVYYVTGLTKGTNLYAGTYYAQAVSLADGTVSDIALKTADTDTYTAFGYASSSALTGAVDATGTTNFKPVQGLYTFDKDGSKYTAEKYTGDSTYTVQSIGNIADKLAKDDTKMTIGSKKVYLNESTTYIKVATPGTDIDVKFVVGGTSTAKLDKSSNAVQALAVTKKDAKNDLASYVILLAAADFNNAGSEDVVYVHEVSKAKVSYTDADGKVKTGYDTELYFLDGSGKVESVTVSGASAKAVGFYTWEINDDKVYELTPTATSLSIGGAAYDDETGSVGTIAAGYQLDGVYKNTLTAAKLSGKSLADVDFAANVIIRDDRNAATRDASVYTSKIESVSALKSAVDRSNDKGTPVTAVVYYDNGEVIMVYVVSTAAASSVTPTLSSDAEVVGKPTVSGSAINIDFYVEDGSTKTNPFDIDDIAAILAKEGYTDIAYDATTNELTFKKGISSYTIAGTAITQTQVYKVAVKVCDANKAYASVTDVSTEYVKQNGTINVEVTFATLKSASRTFALDASSTTGVTATLPGAATSIDAEGVATFAITVTSAKDGTIALSWT